MEGREKTTGLFTSAQGCAAASAKKKLCEETKEGIEKEKTSCVWMEFYFKVHIDPDRIVTSGM